MIEKTPPKRVSFSDFIFIFAMLAEDLFDLIANQVKWIFWLCKIMSNKKSHGNL